MDKITQQYERWPYPAVPLIARVHREQLWQINLKWMKTASGLPQIKNPKIWIAGCGTFQPYVFSRANPDAEILATDISQNSLKNAEKRCRWHSIRNVRLSRVDLNDDTQYPDEKFDLIECYGVLMNLERPDLVLIQLSKRLKPNGILRLMVYPHYGRQRILQIQRLARILGLSSEISGDPKLLKSLIHHLPYEHPLRSTFDTYADANNLAGIVDGFLHASQKAYSGIELSWLMDQANLQPVYFYHRPWGQPQKMAEALGIQKQDLALWIHYVDLWQSLRTNFTVCLTAKESKRSTDPLERHPLFDISNEQVGFRHRGRLLRLGTTGSYLQSRTTDGNLRMSPSQIRQVLVGNFDDEASKEVLAPTPSNYGPLFLTTSPLIQPNLHFAPRIGKSPVNPLYAHLFDAYVFDQQWNHLFEDPLPSLETQLSRWKKVDENFDPMPWGITPFATWAKYPRTVASLVESFMETPLASFSDCQLEHESDKVREVNRFLRAVDYRPRRDLSKGEYRELWTLLFSFKDLSLLFK